MPGRLTLVSMRGRLRFFTAVAVLVASVVGPATGAAAFTINTHICDSAPDAGFTDVAADNPHKTDIDCLRYWGVTNQKGTFDPTSVVSRWQIG